MGNICIIPARGGSKRIPRKNIKLFLGKPIIAYSIKAALNSQLFDEVMVSTDDAEIKQIALAHGASVPFIRSPETSNDYSPTFEVIKEVLANYESQHDKKFDLACCLYPTAPFVNSKYLKDSFQTLKEFDFDTVFPVIPFGFPIQRALKRSNDHKTSFMQPNYALTRSQDLAASFHDAGQYYWLNVVRCLKNNALISENFGTIIIDEMNGQDIDNEIDWKLAELKYGLL